MEYSFKLTVIYNGEARELEAHRVTGYSHRCQVDVDGVTVLYKPSNKGKYRALIDCDTPDKSHSPNKELIILVAERLQELFPGCSDNGEDDYKEPERLVMEIIKIEFTPVQLDEEDEAICED